MTHPFPTRRSSALTYQHDDFDWKGALTDERTHLTPVQVDTWGGWVFINMDPDAEPLRDFLEPAATHLDPFELGKKRYKGRQWVIFYCNWKTAREALMERYHPTAHPPHIHATRQK